METYGLEVLEYENKLFINANAPNLEEFTFDGNLLGIYTSSDANSLKKPKIDCTDLHAYQELDSHLEAADNLHRLFTGILNVTYLSVSAPIFGDPHIVYQYCLPTFVNFEALEATSSSLLLLATFDWFSECITKSGISCLEKELRLPISTQS